MNIALIGPRGCGKTRISKVLSQELKWPIFSLDVLISYEAKGRSIPQIVSDADGDWRPFRDLEYKVLKKTTRLDNVIIDCGGGIVVDLDDEGDEVLSERKTERLKKNATVFFLHPPLEQILAKMGGDSNRPSLSATASAREIFDRRLPWYRQTADHEMPVSKLTRIAVAHKIIEMVADEV